MAETVVWNKKLLAASLILGVLAVGLFYAYDSLQQAKAEENRVRVLKWKINGKSGQEVAQDDFASVEIPLATFTNLDGVLKDNEEDRSLARGGHLSRNVKRNDFVRFSDILENKPEVPSRRIKIGGYRAFPLRVDPYRTVGDLLRVDDHIDIIGLLSISNKPARAYTLIENLRVLAVGGRSKSPVEAFRERGRQRVEPSMRVYRTLTVEVKKRTAEQMAELLPRVRGKIWVVVRNPKEPPPPKDRDGLIPKEVVPVLDDPLPDDIDRE